MITKIKQKRIRILYIITSCKKTGPVQQTLNIIKNLDKKFEPVLLTLYEEDQDGTSRLDEFLQYAVHYFVKTSKTDILLGHTKALKKKMQEIRPDVIHSLGVFPDYAVSKIHEYPHLITLRNYIWDDYPMMYGRIRGGVLARLHIYAMDHATKTVTCSESLSWIYKKKLGKEFSFIRNGVDVQESALVSAAEKPEIRKELGIGREDFVFIYSGLFIDRKNQEFLVRTFADTFPETNVKLVLLGDGPNFDEIRNAYGFYRNVMFPGNVLDVVRYLKASDVYVSVSKSEGMPNGVLEAMAFGLPVLLSDIIQHKEIMRVCRECGFLYKQNDASSLSEKMKKMTGCNMGKMIQHSFDTAHGSFHAAKMSEKYQQQYGMLAELNSGLQVKTMKKKK